MSKNKLKYYWSFYTHNIGKAMLLFFIGIVEMLIIAAWTKSVVGEKVLLSGVISMVNVMIWYYVLETVLQNIHDIRVVLLYALGCSIGTMLASVISKMMSSQEKQALSVGEDSSLAME